MTIKRIPILCKLGKWLVDNYCDINITNIKINLPNPHTLILKFNANQSRKQLILQGDYVDKYKEFKNDIGENCLNQTEQFELIRNHQKQWFNLTKEE